MTLLLPLNCGFLALIKSLVTKALRLGRFGFALLSTLALEGFPLWYLKLFSYKLRMLEFQLLQSDRSLASLEPIPEPVDQMVPGS